MNIIIKSKGAMRNLVYKLQDQVNILSVKQDQCVKKRQKESVHEYQEKIESRLELIFWLEYTIDNEFVDSISLTKDEMEMINDQTNKM